MQTMEVRTEDAFNLDEELKMKAAHDPAFEIIFGAER